MRHIPLVILCAALLLLSGCMVGPKYVRPHVPATPRFKETGPDSFKEMDGWKTAQPGDAQLRGKWWELFNDPKLNELEEQVDGANQTLKQAEAAFQGARSVIRARRSEMAPTVTAGASTGAERLSANQPYFNKSAANNGVGSFSLPFDLNYEIDLWGRIRRQITSAAEQAQASAADLETARLSLHAELAMDYFELRSADAQKRLLSDTVKAYAEALQLTQDRFDGGASPLSDVTQARTQLQTAQVAETDVAVDRARYEHAIAVLVGKPPAELNLEPMPLTIQQPMLPAIPGVLPSQLLERRPDIAAAERRMASANEQIGIARAAWFPTLSLSAVAGFAGTSALNWFSWPSRMWAVGPAVSQTLFDYGLRRATSEAARAGYEATVASYRQSALTAFQQVEDNLAALRELEKEARQQTAATDSALQSLDIFKVRYEGGVDTYLQVITSQTAALQNQRNEIDILRQRIEAHILLVKALGGGWTSSSLPQLAKVP
ncbi:efflux transporter outer membrane subunit [Paludibaculum fermentans]|uniref:Efflux transporter outer membrane subunit n=1 Tax=Paludibaculum fermentans TaxID=1473598 RepID=A0A7S7NXR6_PALFE|nr:efflux transporter outer membrane subunit [Paludibaculum fermentans]QOY91710.1 efflux transporter outer membrane subunit [Paludibaculum fermentans]